MPTCGAFSPGVSLFVTPDEVEDATGLPLEVPDDTPTTPPPSEEELKLLTRAQLLEQGVSARLVAYRVRSVRLKGG